MCSAAPSTSISIDGVSYGLQTMTGAICINVASIAQNYTGTLSLKSLNQYLLSTNRISLVDVLAGIQYNFGGTVFGNYSLSLNLNKIGNDMYLNDTVLIV